MRRHGRRDFDAIVLGGGPGGSTAAGFLAKDGLRVALFEKERFPRYHIGESLLPATTMGVLAGLGLKERVESYGFPKKYGGTFLWGKVRKPWTFHFYRTDKLDRRAGGHPRYLHAYQVRRAEFDQMLLEHARALGAKVFEESPVLGLEPGAGGLKSVSVDLGRKGRAVFRAPFVIDASGREGIATKHFGERHWDPFFKNIAVFGYFEGGKRFPGERRGNIYCAAFRRGWFWYIPVSDELTSVGVVMAKAAFERLKVPDPAAILNRMIGECPSVAELLAQARPSRRPLYDRVRVERDFSYCHSEFARGGIFLAGDAACFIDPVFSSGVHLATYAGYLAARAIARVLRGEVSGTRAEGEYDRLYRREYMAFYRFLVSFYQMHREPKSYFWAARKVVARKGLGSFDSFISIVSGTSTTGGRLFSSAGDLRRQVRDGRRSLDALMESAAGRPVDAKKIEAARGFMRPIHEGRRRLFAETLGPGRG